MSLSKYNDFIYIVIVIISLYLFINKEKEHFTEISDIPSIDDIINGYKLDIPSTRNLAQLANKTFTPIPDSDKYKLYLPINKLIFENQLLVLNNCMINKRTDINNNLRYMNKNDITIDYNIFPQYTILAWSLQLEMLPKNWKLCDGSKYILINNELIKYDEKNEEHKKYNPVPTPDLTKRFILNEYKANNINVEDINNNNVTLSKTYEFNKTGGEATVSLSNENIPPHTHYFQLGVNDKKYTYTGRRIINHNTILKENSTDVVRMDYPSALQSYVKDLYLSESVVKFTGDKLTNLGVRNYSNSKWCQLNVGDSSDPFYIKNNDFNIKTSTLPHNNMPPYYRLYYVIKLI
jgi:hypothetical protein